MITAEIITNALITSAFFAVTCFLGRYLRVKWYTSTEGRVTMALFTSLFFVFLLVTIGTYTDNSYPGRTQVRIIAYAGVNMLLWPALYLLLTDQRRGRRK